MSADQCLNLRFSKTVTLLHSWHSAANVSTYYSSQHEKNCHAPYNSSFDFSKVPLAAYKASSCLITQKNISVRPSDQPTIYRTWKPLDTPPRSTHLNKTRLRTFQPNHLFCFPRKSDTKLTRQRTLIKCNQRCCIQLQNHSQLSH